MAFTDITGRRFGRLAVIERTSVNGRQKWRCLCDCGAERLVATYDLTSGKQKSCGCLKNEISKLTRRTHGRSSGRKNRLYKIWMGIRARCRIPSASGYEYYGARGISVCDAWNDFLAFEEWALANGYDDSLSIDRIDHNGNYTPHNCRWATVAEQNRNTRHNVIVEIDGKRACVKDHASAANVSYWALITRIRRGQSPQYAMDVLRG